MNPELDLELRRIIRAPRSAVWRAWTDAEQLRGWFIPAPTVLRVDRLDVRPGGGLVTSFSEDGTAFQPHIDAVFLVVEENAPPGLDERDRQRMATPTPATRGADRRDLDARAP